MTYRYCSMFGVLDILQAPFFGFIRRRIPVLDSRLSRASLNPIELISLRTACSYGSAYLSLIRLLTVGTKGRNNNFGANEASHFNCHTLGRAKVVACPGHSSPELANTPGRDTKCSN